MKKVFLSLLAVLAAVPAFAVEFTSGDFKARIYGAMYADGFYSYYEDGDGKASHGFGSRTFAGSSKLGVELNYGKISGTFEAGIMDPIRKYFLKYDINKENNHYFVIGRDSTIATYYFGQLSNDGLSLNGYGTLADSRKLQLRYGIKGFEMAVIIPDFGYAPARSGLFSGSAIDNGYRLSIEDKFKYSQFSVLPRLELAYTYSNDIAMVKVYGAYGAYMYDYVIGNEQKDDVVLHSFHVGIGGQVNFGNGFMHYNAFYGQNIYLTSGLSTPGTLMYKVDNKDYVDIDKASKNNIQSVGGAIGFGYNALDGKIIPQIGAGYSVNLAVKDEKNDDSLGAYLNCEFKVADWFSVVPEVALMHNMNNAVGKAEGLELMAGMTAVLSF